MNTTKKIGGYSIILVLLLFLIPSVQSTTVVSCYDSGKVTIDQISPAVTGNVYAKRLNDASFRVPGEWTADRSSNAVHFNSDEGLFLERAFYEVEIRVTGGKYVGKTLCPGFKFSCRYFEPKIDSCMNKGESKTFLTFQADVYDPNILRFEFLDSNNETYVYSADIKDSEVSDIEISNTVDGMFVVVLESAIDIKYASVTHDSCYKDKSKYFTKVTSRCDRSCISNEECNSDEFCELNVCRKLNCRDCYSFGEHRCIFKCDDGNPCTQDSCDNSSCVNRVTLGCPLDGACVSEGSARNISGESVFCDGSSWLEKKDDGEGCVVNYECVNSCIGNKCVDPVSLLPPPKKTLEEIIGQRTIVIISTIFYVVFMLFFLYYVWRRRHPFKKTPLEKINVFINTKITENKIKIHLKEAEAYYRKGEYFTAKKKYDHLMSLYNKLSSDDKKEVKKRLSGFEKKLDDKIKG